MGNEEMDSPKSNINKINSKYSKIKGKDNTEEVSNNSSVIREQLILGHSEPITKGELNEIFKKEDSMCIIYSKNKSGMGFFLNLNENYLPFHKCLMTNYYILNENDIRENNNKINIIHQNKIKVIIMNKKRKIYINKNLGYTCIQILNEDNINQYFEIDNNIGIEQNILSLQLLRNQNGYELSFSSGKILSKTNYIIKHTCPIRIDSAGSPVISIYPNIDVIGFHYSTEKNKEFNIAININSIINDIINKFNNRIIKEINVLNSENNKFYEKYKEKKIHIENSEPITKTEIIKLLNKEDSMCIIFSRKEKKSGELEKTKGSGFFLCLNNKNIPFNKCLVTNNHILDEKNIKLNSKINIKYINEKKIIIMNEKRKKFTDKDLDYTCIEILNEDKIKQFFEIDNKQFYKDQDIFILQYPESKELSFSNGKIISIEGNKIKQTCSTKPGSSGSPIISRNSNSKIIGLHFGGREYNYFTSINSIINDIINKSNVIIEQNSLDLIEKKFEDNSLSSIINYGIRVDFFYDKEVKKYQEAHNIKNNCEPLTDTEIISLSKKEN